MTLMRESGWSGRAGVVGEVLQEAAWWQRAVPVTSRSHGFRLLDSSDNTGEPHLHPLIATEPLKQLR